MYNLRNKLIAFAAAAVLNVFSLGASADVIFPALAIDTFGTDAGISSDGTTLTIDATAFSIELDSIPTSTISLTPADFSLTATYSSFDGGITYTFINGSLSAGSYLSANFDSLSMMSTGFGNGVFAADLIYTGGTLVAGLTNGRLEGGFVSATSSDFSQAFTASNISGTKIGPVVPVPAAVWLFGSGLLGLVGVARRNKAAA